jgi:hypothetical protein
MKTNFTAEATFKSRRSETDQTMNGPQNAKLADRGIARPFSAGYGWPVQSYQSSVRGCDDADFMKSQLG